MSTFVVVDKQSFNEVSIDSSNINIQTPSLIQTQLHRGDVAEFTQDGNNLILKLKNGKTIVINNFFIKAGDEESELQFADEECAVPIWPWLLGAAAIGGGAALASGGGGGGSDGESLPPTPTVTVNGYEDNVGNTPENIYHMNSTNDNTPTISGTAKHAKEVEIIINGKSYGTVPVDENGHWKLPELTEALKDGIHTITAVVKDAYGNKVVSNEYTVTVDTVPPTVKVDIDEKGKITINFPDEDFDPESFDPNDVIIMDKDGNPIKVEFTPNEDGSSWTGKVPDGIDGDVTVTVPDDSYADKAGNTGSKGDDNAQVDTKAPTVNVEIDEKGNITINFPDEDFDPESFNPDDVIFTDTDGNPVLDKDGNPIKVEFTPNEDGSSWIGKVPDGIDGDVTVTVPDGSYADKAGNIGSKGDNTATVDTPPVVKVEIDEEGNITINFPDEDFDPESFNPDNVIFTDTDGNPILDKDGNPIKVEFTPNEDGSSWTGKVPDGIDGDVTVTVPDGSYADKAGNTGSKDDDTATVDTPPVVKVEIDEEGNIKITFPNEDFDPSTFDPETDIEITDKDGNPVLDKDGNPIKVEFEKGKDNTWTGKIPEGVDNDITVTVPDGSYADKAGNTGSKGDDNSPVDTKAPTVTVNIDEKGNITINFPDEDFDPSTFDPETDIEITDKDGNPILDQDGNPIKVEFTPGEDNTWTGKIPNGIDGDVTVTVPDGSYSDTSGNTGSKGHDTATVDTPPVVKVEIDEKGNITINFPDEDFDPESFNPKDVIIMDKDGNPIKVEFTPNENGSSWTGRIPDGIDADVTVTVPDGSYADKAGNTGAKGDDNAPVDTKAPTVKVTIDPDNKNSVTFEFSEAPYGADGKPLTKEELKELIKAENAEIDFDNLEISDDGLTWTAPIQAESEGDMKVDIVVDGDKTYTDKAGNVGGSDNDSVTVKPPKLEQSSEFKKIVISGTDADGNTITDGKFSSGNNDLGAGNGDPNKYYKHELNFEIPTDEDADSIRAVINLDTLDNSFMIWVNGKQIVDEKVFQIESGDKTHIDSQINLVFGDGKWLSDGKPWDENVNKLPRFQIVITNDGIRFYATRYKDSTDLEEIFRLDPITGKPVPFVLTLADEHKLTTGDNTIVVGNADGIGQDKISGSLNISVGGKFVISDEDSENLESITITLTGAKEGDKFIPVLPEGIKHELIKDEEGTLLGIRLYGEASKQAYEDALNSLMFKGIEAGEREITITLKDTSGLESEVAEGSIHYSPDQNDVTLGEFEYTDIAIASIEDGESIIPDTDALVYDLFAEQQEHTLSEHSLDNLIDAALANSITDDHTDVTPLSEDFFVNLTLDDLISGTEELVGNFITVDYDAKTDTATISVDKDGDESQYASQMSIELYQQDTRTMLDELLEHNPTIIG